ncbi:uncharacterized protein LOC134255099 [Saccostrea cucullata]|uniref:uncharacterized protein LOC134255099 n=1 Tax=Saccostrea cuccullata TaxID=36930 RepID=UPI002ED37167
MLQAERYLQTKLKSYYKILEDQSKAVPNDARQIRYCKYITRFASHFGAERCEVVGSTIEGTRLRSHKDEGDYDYLIISGITIPVEALEHREDVPCFVRVLSDKLKVSFSSDLVVDGKYLHSRILKYLDKEAFKIIRGLFHVITVPTQKKGSEHMEFNREAKPGMTQEHFAGVELLNESSSGGNHYQTEADDRRYTGNTDHYFKSVVESSNLTPSMKNLLINLVNMIAESTPQDTALFHTFGGLIEAVSSSEVGRSSSPQKLRKHDLQEGAENPDGMYDESARKCIVRFNYKSSKDFIAAFLIEGKLKCLEEWKQRMMKRETVFWPNPETVEKIYNSEVYIVAKPAIVEPKQSIDFCLGFNQAELILAHSLGADQKLCLLLLKSLQKGFLGSFSKTLTTFHWKTAFYHSCEQIDSSLFDRKSTLLLALNMVLSYMAECLEKGYLRHYFIESNLIAHISPEEATGIREKINEIIQDPEVPLQVYFDKTDKEKKQTELISEKELRQVKPNDSESAKKSKSHKLIEMWSQFQEASKSDDSKFNKALLDTLYLVLEEETDFDVKIPRTSTQSGGLPQLLAQAAQYRTGNFTDREEKKKALNELRSSALQMLFSMSKK